MMPRTIVVTFGVMLGLGSFLAPPVHAVDIVDPVGRPVSLEVSQGRLVRLDRKASTVFVADPEVADVHVKSPSLVYVLAKAPGETTLFAVDEGENILASLNLSVTQNLPALRDALTRLYPDVAVSVVDVNGAVVLRGLVPSGDVAEAIQRLAVRMVGEPELVMNQLSVASPSQVNLRVRVAEMSRDVEKQFGFNWNNITTPGGTDLLLFVDNQFANNVDTEQLGFSKSSGRYGTVNGFFDLLEDEGLVKVLAEPNLTAISGQTASFLAGGEFPILVPDSNGRVTIEFRNFGISLDFTPTLIGKDRINLHVRPEVSQLSPQNSVTLNNFVVPGLTTRRAETTVELGSGQSFAIAGLLQNDVAHDVSKVPGLGDIPVLGQLFRSDYFRRDESELVILVTPYIVKPVNSPDTLADPTEGFLPPHDIERLFFVGTHRRNPQVPPPVTVGQGGRRLIGPAGFEIE